MVENAHRSVLDRLSDALNRNDVDALIECFHPDYRSEQPAHPGRSFTGADRARDNWRWVFETFPDFRADLVRWTFDGEVYWTEWRWHGTNAHKREPMDVRGVALFGMDGERIRWARLYLEPIEGFAAARYQS